MARGKGKAGPSVPRILPEDNVTARPGPLESNDSFQMGTDAEDGEDSEDSIGYAVDPRNYENEITAEYSEENATDIATSDGEDVSKDVEFTAVHGINENTTAEDSTEDTVVCVLKEVINGQYIYGVPSGDEEDILKEEGKLTCIIGGPEHEQNTEINEVDAERRYSDDETNNEVVLKEEHTTGSGEDILKEEGKLTCINGGPEHEQNTEKNEEDADSNGEANNEDLLKEEHLAKEENEREALCMVTPEQVENNEHSTEENNKEKVEEISVQRRIKSRKRKRGKGWVKSSLKNFTTEGKKKKKVPSNGEEAAENEGDAPCKDDSTREDIMEQDNGEENNAEDNKKKVEQSLKQKLTKNRKRRRGKKKKSLEKSVLENVASEGCGEMGPKKMTSNGEDKESLKVRLKGEEDQGVKKGVSKGEALLCSKNLTPQGKDVPESSHRKRSSEKSESAGLIFMCNSETKKDCFRYSILGLPANKRETVENVYKGMILFLYDVDLKLMYGIYKATEPGGYNIEPKAFKSQFPSQVRFVVLDDCKPLAEEIFKTAIRKNYYSRKKFNCQLTSEQVKDLCKLFTAHSRGSTSKKLGERLKKESKRVVERDRIGNLKKESKRVVERGRIGNLKKESKRVVERGRIGNLKKESKRVVERDRTGKHGVDKARRLKAAEGKRGLNRDRTRKYGVDRDRRRSPVNNHRYHDYSHHYEKDMIAPAMDRHLQPLPPAPVAQGSHLLPLRPLASAQPYVYDRPLETDAYRRGPILVRDDPYRREMLQEPQDAYRQDILIDCRHYHTQEHKPEHHYSYETTDYDRHASYIGRGEAVYRNIPPAGLPVDYYSVDHRSGGVSVPEYHVISRSVPEYHPDDLRREYQSSSGLRPEYRSSGGLQPEYRSSGGLQPDYRSSGGLWPEYQSSVGMRRYPY